MEVPRNDSFQLFERERNQPIHQWVNHVLRMNIIRLHLKPGQEISETEISSRLGISRTPVREAFIRLGEDGLLEVRPQRCTVISRIDLDQAEETRFVRRTLEKSITKEACGAFSAAGVDELTDNLRMQKKFVNTEDYEGLLAADDEFHRTIYRHCGKERVWDFIKKLDNSHDRLRLMTLSHIAERIFEEHKAILDLIIENDSNAVDDVVESHLTNKVISQVIFEYPAEYFVQDPRAYAELSRSVGSTAATPCNL